MRIHLTVMDVPMSTPYHDMHTIKLPISRVLSLSAIPDPFALVLDLQ